MSFLSKLRSLWNTPPRHSVEHRVKSGRTRRFDAARRGKDFGNWIASSNSANADIWGAIATIRARSRDLIRNNDYASGAIQKYVDNVIYQGISFQAQVKQLKDKTKNDDRINNAIESSFKDWSEQRLWCHTAGKLNFNQIQQVAFHSCLESGEVFIRKVKKSFSNSPIPFALEIIEADQLAEDYNQIYGNNQVVMGIEIDRWQRPVAYWFYKSHPGDTWSANEARKLERIEAKEIIHLHRSSRPNQIRGIPVLVSSILRLKNVGDYEGAEQLAAKLAACVMAVITSDYNNVLGEHKGGESPDDEELPADEKFVPGIMRTLAPGEKFEAFDPKRPNANLVEFLEQQLRAVAAGMGLSYEIVSNDYSETNYSSARLSLICARDRYKVSQAWFASSFLKEVIYGNPESNGWLDVAVMSGVLNFPDYELVPKRYQAVKWQFRGWAWVDPHKEVKATLSSLAGGMTSLTDHYAEQGKDFEEQMKVIVRERELLKSMGIEVNFDGVALADVPYEDDSKKPSGNNQTVDAKKAVGV